MRKLNEMSLSDLDEKIGGYVVRGGPFSHNIIGLLLQQCAEKYGKKEANSLVEKYELELLGFNKE